MQIRLDVKRNIECRSKIGRQIYGLCDVLGSVDLLMINLSQKDLATILNIWEDNISKIIAMHRSISLIDTTIEDEKIHDKMHFVEEDETVKKLEVFFTHDEHPVCEVNMKMTFDGLQFNLFTDSDEVLIHAY